MPENLLLGSQVICLFLVDLSLASLSGLLLARWWIGRGFAPSAKAKIIFAFPRLLAWSAFVLVLALGSQFWLLTMSMAGTSTPDATLHAMQDVAASHAGRVNLHMLFMSVALAIVLALPGRGIGAIARNLLSPALLAAIIFFHSAVGHAAVDGDFSGAELLQFLHLAAMAIWAGGVLVSAFVAIPRLGNASARAYATYLRWLSDTSAWSASAAILTGALKGWIAIDARLGNLAQPGWSRVLLVKLFFVCIALGLGFLHRRRINRSECEWGASERRTLAKTLRIEAGCLAVVLLLSALLSNQEPPE